MTANETGARVGDSLHGCICIENSQSDTEDTLSKSTLKKKRSNKYKRILLALLREHPEVRRWVRDLALDGATGELSETDLKQGLFDLSVFDDSVDDTCDSGSDLTSAGKTGSLSRLNSDFALFKLLPADLFRLIAFQYLHSGADVARLAATCRTAWRLLCGNGALRCASMMSSTLRRGGRSCVSTLLLEEAIRTQFSMAQLQLQDQIRLGDETDDVYSSRSSHNTTSDSSLSRNFTMPFQSAEETAQTVRAGNFVGNTSPLPSPQSLSAMISAAAAASIAPARSPLQFTSTDEDMASAFSTASLSSGTSSSLRTSVSSTASASGHTHSNLENGSRIFDESELNCSANDFSATATEVPLHDDPHIEAAERGWCTRFFQDFPFLIGSVPAGDTRDLWRTSVGVTPAEGSPCLPYSQPTLNIRTNESADVESCSHGRRPPWFQRRDGDCIISKTRFEPSQSSFDIDASGHEAVIPLEYRWPLPVGAPLELFFEQVPAVVPHQSKFLDGRSVPSAPTECALDDAPQHDRSRTPRGDVHSLVAGDLFAHFPEFEQILAAELRRACAIEEAARSLGLCTWQIRYMLFARGLLRFRCQVYDREQREGFRRSYWDALIRVDAISMDKDSSQSHVCCSCRNPCLTSSSSLLKGSVHPTTKSENAALGLNYLVEPWPHQPTFDSTSPFARRAAPVEIVTGTKIWRLRRVPTDFRGLNPRMTLVHSDPAGAACSAMQVGDIVEAQWKTLELGSFGLWWGKIGHISQHRVEHDVMERQFVTVVFDQFPPNSRWRYITFPHPALRWPMFHPALASFTGGLHKVAEREIEGLREAIAVGSESAISVEFVLRKLSPDDCPLEDIRRQEEATKTALSNALMMKVDQLKQ